MKKYLLYISVIFLFINITSEESRGFMFWNQACSFNGTAGSYIAVNNSATLNITGSFSVETWILPLNSVSPASQIILDKRTGTMPNGYGLLLINGKVSVRTNATIRLIGKSVLPNNSWTHIAGVFNEVSGVFSIYLNGVLDTAAVYSNSIPSANTDSVTIGKGNTGSAFGGKLDELRLWSKALTATEVSAFRRTSLGTSTGVYQGLVLSLTFQDNESSGTDFSLSDWSGNNNTGRNNGVNSVDLSNRPSNTISLNEGIDLDGSGDYLSGPDNSDVSPTAGITMECWIFPRNITGSKVIINKGPASGSGANFGLRLNGSTLNAVINGNTTFNASNVIFPNIWTHVAFTYEGSSGKYAFYINGRKSGEGINPAGLIINGTDNLYIGGTGISGSGFNGLLDELRISNYIKSQLQINRYLFQSIDQANEPNSGMVNVSYNLDGYAYDNSDNGPLLSFFDDAVFSNPGTTDNQPVSPIDRADNINFQNSFSLKSANLRIPETGNTGLISDSIEICFDTLITDVNLYLALNHSAEEELVVYLQGPGGETVTLYNKHSLINNADNIVTVFDDQSDSSLTPGIRYVSFSPSIKPLNSMNSVFTGKNTSGTWKLFIKDETGTSTGRLYGWGIQFNNFTRALSGLCLRVFMEGFYREIDSCVTDTIKVHLRNSTAPYEDVGVKGETPDNNYIGKYSFDTASFGTGYYLQVEHRNSIETWSANPAAFDFLSGTLLYDFTVSADSAYGSNQVNVEDIPLRYAMFGGDANQDDIVDAGDIGLVENDISSSGYIDTDMTGDDYVDAEDLSLVENNSIVPVITITP